MSALSLFASGLSGTDIQVQIDGVQPRPIIAGHHFILPRILTAQRRLALAAVAHATAHLLHSVPSRSVKGLKPIGIAIISAIEDARVERLLLQDFPGLRHYFSDSLPPRPAPDDLSFAALVTRMDRLLADPQEQDDNYWVNKARRLFDETVIRAGLADYDSFRAVASILANDLGQMRVRFDPQQHTVPAPYRDDNSYLWDFSEMAQQADEAVSMQTTSTSSPPNPTDSEETLPPTGAADFDIARFSYPEWDYRIDHLRPDWCTVIEKAPVWQGLATDPQKNLLTIVPISFARRRHVSRSRRLRRQWEGDDIDLNAAIEVMIDRRLKLQPEPRMFTRAGTEVGATSVLVLLDFSASTSDPGKGNTMSMLDIEKQVALTLTNAATHEGDRIAIHGFSSNTRAEVYYTKLIEFGAMPTPTSQAQIFAIQARYSTRIGAAIRHATSQLCHEPIGQRAILIVTDGAPSDIDVHDPLYLIEDARAAVLDARLAGVSSYCIAVHSDGDAYARRIFGWGNYCVAEDPANLPAQLHRAYARLASNLDRV